MELDLLELSSENEDQSANSWIWISGEKSRKKINRILDEIIATENLTKTQLIIDIAKKLKVSVGPLNRSIYGKADEIPIPILKELLERSISKHEYKKFFITSATKIFTSRRKKVNAIKEISIDLAEIMGAFAADGHLSVLVRAYSSSKDELLELMKRFNVELTIQEDRDKFFIRTSKISQEQLLQNRQENISYSFSHLFEIVDAERSAVETIAQKIKEEFGISGKIVKKKEAWSYRTYNKILTRYFRLFGLSSGRKTETVSEPLVLKNKSLDIKLGFVRGVLTFDGTVKYSGEVYITLKNDRLPLDLSTIVSSYRIRNFVTIREPRYTLTIDHNNEKSLSLFIPNTKKWFRLRDYLYGFKIKVKTIAEAKNIIYESYDRYNRKSASFLELMEFIQKKGETTSTELTQFFKTSDGGFYSKLRILNRMNIVEQTDYLFRNKKGKFEKKYAKYKFNNNLEQWLLPSFKIDKDI